MSGVLASLASLAPSMTLVTALPELVGIIFAIYLWKGR
jgi:hypothetical protein